MSFKSLQEAETRLADPKPLSSKELFDLFEHINQLSESAMRRLTLQHLQALQNFERNSRRLTIVLIVLTVILVALTIVIACYTVVLARKEPSVAGHQPASSQASTKKTLGPWKAKFNIPGTAVLPDDNPTVKCSFAKSADAGVGFIAVTVDNLSKESHTVRYNIYGYDQNGRRISQGGDEFAIGKRETVLRSVFLKSEESVPGKLGSVFWIQMVLED
jgi:hypothetical protein